MKVSDNIHIISDVATLRKVVETSVRSALSVGDSEGLISPEQACNLLKINRSTLWRWVKKGVIHPLYDAGRIRVRRSEVTALITLKDRCLKAEDPYKIDDIPF